MFPYPTKFQHAAEFQYVTSVLLCNKLLACYRCFAGNKIIVWNTQAQLFIIIFLIFSSAFRQFQILSVCQNVHSFSVLFIKKKHLLVYASRRCSNVCCILYINKKTNIHVTSDSRVYYHKCNFIFIRCLIYFCFMEYLIAQLLASKQDSGNAIQHMYNITKNFRPHFFSYSFIVLKRNMEMTNKGRQGGGGQSITSIPVYDTTGTEYIDPKRRKDKIELGRI